MKPMAKKALFGTTQEVLLTPKLGYEVEAVEVFNKTTNEVVASQLVKTMDNPPQWVCSFVQPAGVVSLRPKMKPVYFSVVIEECENCSIVLLESNDVVDVKVAAANGADRSEDGASDEVAEANGDAGASLEEEESDEDDDEDPERGDSASKQEDPVNFNQPQHSGKESIREEENVEEKMIEHSEAAFNQGQGDVSQSSHSAMSSNGAFETEAGAEMDEGATEIETVDRDTAVNEEVAQAIVTDEQKESLQGNNNMEHIVDDAGQSEKDGAVVEDAVTARSEEDCAGGEGLEAVHAQEPVAEDNAIENDGSEGESEAREECAKADTVADDEREPDAVAVTDDEAEAETGADADDVDAEGEGESEDYAEVEEEEKTTDSVYDAGEFRDALKEVEPKYITQAEFDRKSEIFWKYKKQYNAGMVDKATYNAVLKKHSDFMDAVSQGKIVIRD